MIDETNNSWFNNAKKAKNDEFYTHPNDIESEVNCYSDKFSGKIVYCNCDSPWSGFYLFFKKNYNNLGLKGLVATGYDENGGDFVYFNGKDEVVRKLNGNGDFSSDECLKILKKCDIVCSNPPFSLFRKYMTIMLNSRKDLLIIGPQSQLSYPIIFHAFKDGILHCGYGYKSSSGNFLSKHYEDGNIDPKNIMRVNGVMWFTTFETESHKSKIDLYKGYNGNEPEYPKFDDYDAINVNSYKDIPKDYYGPIGVPVTFLKKFNPEQFEIIGLDREIRNDGKRSRFHVNGGEKSARVIIRRKDNPLTNTFNDLTSRMDNL